MDCNAKNSIYWTLWLMSNIIGGISLIMVATPVKQ